MTPGGRALKASAKRGGASHDCALESARRCLRHLCPPPSPYLPCANERKRPPSASGPLLPPAAFSFCRQCRVSNSLVASGRSSSSFAFSWHPRLALSLSLSRRLLRALYGPSPPPCSGTTSAAASFSSSLRLSSSCPRRWRPQHRGCMIRLQSSMSNHIPVSSGLFPGLGSPALISLSLSLPPSLPPCLPLCSLGLRASRGREGKADEPDPALLLPAVVRC